MSEPTPTANINGTTETTTTDTKIIVHHLNNSRSQRILWLLEELEVPYEIKKYQRTSEMRAPAELKDIHPLGKSPVITDGDVSLAESGAIIEYIIEKYGGDKCKPAEAGKIDNIYFTHYAEGSLMPILVNKIIFTIVPKRAPFFLRPIAKLLFDGVSKQLIEPSLKEHAAFIEAHLAKTNGDWFAGGSNATAADYQMIFPLEAMSSRGSEWVGPKTQDYVKRVHDRPAFKRALEKGGKYDLAG